MGYALVAIVRDEAENIDRLIAAAKPYIFAATLVDTGSEDDTVERIAAAGYEAHRVEWENFGQARSAAFALARGTADFLLALDCDMAVEIDDDFVPDPTVDAYMVALGSADFQYRLPLVLNGSLPWESRGAVHEYSCLPDRAYVGVPTDKVRVTMHGGDRSSREKSLWHAEMLEAALAEHPDNARDVFYLANTYWDLHDPRALAMYERRMKMGGYAEEAWYAAYRHALLLPTWPAQVQALISAWEMRPSRLESPYEIAKALNARGEHHAAYRFASVPIVPTADNLFVHTSVWAWGMKFERSIAAYWVDRKDECRDLCDELLAVPTLPQHIRDQVGKNRAFC